MPRIQHTTPVSLSLQKLFIIALATAFFASFSLDVWRAVAQYSSNPNLSSFYIGFLSMGLLPAAILVTSMLLLKSPNQPRVTWLFESMVAAVSGVALWSLLNLVFGQVTYSLHLLTEEWSMFGAFTVPAILAAVAWIVLSLYLVRVRRARRQTHSA